MHTVSYFKCKNNVFRLFFLDQCLGFIKGSFKNLHVIFVEVDSCNEELPVVLFIFVMFCFLFIIYT